MRIQKKYATYFLELDSVCGTGIPFDAEVISMLRKASRCGCWFIAYTSDKEPDTKKTLEYMRNEGINVLQIVPGCTASKVKAIINTKKLLEETVLEV
jgi:hypothetical protein